MARYPTILDPDNQEAELFKVLNKFENRFVRNHAAGRPSRYEVHVDNIREIGPTEDPADFADVLDFVDMRKTKEVDIRIYHKHSRNNDRHVYFLNKPKTALAGVDEQLQAETEQKVRREFEFDQMKEELAKLKAENKELDEYSDQLEEELKTYRSKKLHLGDVNLVEVGGMLLEGYLKRNPQVLGKLVGGGGLAGPGADYPTEESEQAEAATVERADPEPNPNLAILTQIQDAFSQSEFESVMRILDVLSVCPEKIPEVLSTLEGTHSNVNL